MLFLDTHAIIWLYNNEMDKFSSAGKALIEEENLVYSPMAAFELQYLFEIHRINVPAEDILEQLSELIGLEPDPLSFLPIIETACSPSWTRDPFDRIIAAHATYREAHLLSRDRSMLENCRFALW